MKFKVWYKLSHYQRVDIYKRDILTFSRHDWRHFVPHLEHQRARADAQKSSKRKDVLFPVAEMIAERRRRRWKETDGRVCRDSRFRATSISANKRHSDVSVPPSRAKIFRTAATSKLGTKSKVDQTYDLCQIVSGSWVLGLICTLRQTEEGRCHN